MQGRVSTAVDWDAHYATGAGHRWWPSEELVRWVGGKRFGRALEAGCGNGANLWYLAERADVVFGVDACPAALDAARAYMERRRADAVVLACGDVRRLSSLCGDTCCDLVVDCMTSQHLAWDEHGPLYAEYRRVLRPGGWLWLYHLDIETQQTDARDGWSTSALDLFPGVGFFCLPPSWELRRVVAQAGFAVRQSYGMAREYDGGRVAHYAIVAAEAS